MAGVLIAGCTSGQVGTPPHTTPVSIAGGTSLQLAVGTATLVDTTGATHVGLNVVETFRNAAGSSATTTNTPTLSGPPAAFGVNVLGAISALSGLTLTQMENLAAQTTATGRLVNPTSASPEYLFGGTIGAFGYGLAPDNLLDVTAASELEAACPGPEFTGSQSLTYGFIASPYSPTGIPSYCNLSAPPSAAFPQFKFIGGPPIWPSPAGYGLPTGFPGWSSGFSVVVPCASTNTAGVRGAACGSVGKPVAGTYQLAVQVPNGGNSTSYATKSASAVLPAASVANPLPAFAAAPTVVLNGDGTAQVDLTVPSDPRVAETIVYLSIADCLGGNGPPAGDEPTHYYALITTQRGPQTLFLSNLGPPDAAGNPTHTFCDLADAQAQQNLDPSLRLDNIRFPFTLVAVGFDYPAFEASYPANTQTLPAIVNAQSRTADLSISPQLACPGPNAAGGYVPPANGGALTITGPAQCQ
jgi:hypothetical protein